MEDCKNIHFSCDIPVRYHVDVCVIGAGPAGCAAATCAAEQGVSVLLIESSAMAGGMSTAARVSMFMPVATTSGFRHDLPSSYIRFSSDSPLQRVEIKNQLNIA